MTGRRRNACQIRISVPKDEVKIDFSKLSDALEAAIEKEKFEELMLYNNYILEDQNEQNLNFGPEHGRRPTMNAIDPKLELPQNIIRMARKLPTAELLSILMSYVEELKADYEMKIEYLKENEWQKNKIECYMLFKLKTDDVQLIQHLIDNKLEEIEGEKLQLQCIANTEDEWKKRVKMTQNNKFTAMEEYMTKMKELRKQIEFLAVGVDNETLRQEIEIIKQSRECILDEIRNRQGALDAIEDAVSFSNRNIERYIDAIKDASIGDIVRATEIKEKENEVAAIDRDIESLLGQ